MSTATAFRALMDRSIRHFGDSATVTLRRRHSLKSQRKGVPVGPDAPLTVQGAHLAGVSSINLTVALPTGRLPKGCTFTIAGNATVYTVASDASVSAGVLAVTFTPVLAANAADGAVVTIATPYKDYTLTIQRGQVDAANADTGERQTRRVLHVAYTADVTPESGDLIVDGTSEQRVDAVETFNPGGGVARWDLALGGGA